MPYTYATLTQAIATLAARLYDPDNVFWTADELTDYIQQSLRTWNSLTNFWRSEFLLTPVQSTTWYDITNVTTVPDTLRPFTVTDEELYTLIEYHLLEPATGAVWSGSLQFSLADMRDAIQHRRDEILSTTGCTITRHAIATGWVRTQLPESVIDLRRVAWLPTVTTYSKSPLWPDDSFALQSYQPQYTTQPAGIPASYRQSTEPPLSFDTDIAPAVPGEYEVLSVDAGDALSTTTPYVASTLSIPDDFTWVLVFGALAELLSRESNAKDPLRAQYCEMRYKQGLQLLLNAPAIISARVNNLPLPIDSARAMDDYNPLWQDEDDDEPNTLVTCGLNMIGLSPAPDANLYSLTLTVVENAPIPTSLTDAIQLGKDEYDSILLYAQHLAAFKMGGQEFISTIPLFKHVMSQASLYNSKLSQLGEYTDVIYEFAQRQAMMNPVYKTNNPLMSDAENN